MSITTRRAKLRELLEEQALDGSVVGEGMSDGEWTALGLLHVAEVLAGFYSGISTEEIDRLSEAVADAGQRIAGAINDYAEGSR